MPHTLTLLSSRHHVVPYTRASLGVRVIKGHIVSTLLSSSTITFKRVRRAWSYIFLQVQNTMRLRNVHNVIWYELS